MTLPICFDRTVWIGDRLQSCAMIGVACTYRDRDYLGGVYGDRQK